MGAGMRHSSLRGMGRTGVRSSVKGEMSLGSSGLRVEGNESCGEVSN